MSPADDRSMSNLLDRGPRVTSAASTQPLPLLVTTADARRRILWSMVISLGVVVSAVASLNIALPDLARAIDASQSQLQWIVDAYSVVFAGLLLPAGALGDRLGRRRMLLAGLLTFGAAYGVAAAGTGPTFLIACRAVAGLGAALVMPSTLSIITSSFPPEARSKAVGTWAGVAGAGAMIGLVLSGVLLEVASWRWVFAINAGWALVALVVVVAWAPESTERRPVAIDPVGAVLSAGGLSAVVFATIEGAHRGWTDAVVIAGYLFGAVAIIGFITWELRRSIPLLDPRLFRDRSFANGSLSITVQFLMFYGFVFVGQQYLQLVLGYSPLQAALGLVPLAVLFGAMSRQVTPALMRRLGTTVVDVVGLLVSAVGCALLATVGADSSYWAVLPGLLVLGLGMGLANTPATTAIVSALPSEKQGVASAVNDTAREVGSAVGIAVLGSVLSAGYRDGMGPHLDGLPPGVAGRARDSLAFVTLATDRLGPGGQDLLRTARVSFVDGMHSALWVGAGALVAGSAVIAARRPPPSSEPRSAPSETTR
jgi:EmrB/QacA subfamily drug resistance transporter